MQLRLLLRLALLVLVSMGTASGGDAFFPLMAWNSAPSDATAFQKMRECGLTVADFVSPKDPDLCLAAGLKAMVSDGRVSGYDCRNVDAGVARSH